jgi:hypothetical protein
VPILQQKNNINNIIVSMLPGPTPIYDTSIEKDYDKVFKLGPVHFYKTPPQEMQEQCNIPSPTSDFYLNSLEIFDEIVKNTLEDFKSKFNKTKVICCLSNWYERSFLFTREQYKAGVDVPNLGYGGSHRNVNKIVEKLTEKYVVIPVGFPSGISQRETINLPNNNSRSLSTDASILKHCDYFVGAEGGLYNLSVGLGSKTIITGDYIAQLYGPNGVIRKIDEPKLGGHLYRPDVSHSILDPYYNDEEVVERIMNLIDTNGQEVYDWNEIYK